MKKKKIAFTDVMLYLILTVVVLVCLYPFLNVVAYSLSGNTAVLSGKVTFYPIDFQLSAYKEILLKQTQIWTAMGISVTVTVLGTLLGLVLTVAAAYALSKEKLKGRGILSGFILFTMYFSGGIIPTFLVVKGVGLYDSISALVIPSAMNVFNFIVMRTFFKELPLELEEAARIDGANDMKILFKIALPLSMPIIATIGLFYAVSYWNDYFSALLYIQTPEKFSLQLRLRQLLFAGQINQVSMENLGTQVMSESLKMASIVISTIPIILVYPWLQKYFVKGVMLGSVKG
ncbi:carbohydrate ABC transporter permease [Hungatella sp.]|uniref:carbohydrate ABC transporter permease n=1 Tax=Hungatella sp. TaxID=2613924 RepID=UPI003AB2C778